MSAQGAFLPLGRGPCVSPRRVWPPRLPPCDRRVSSPPRPDMTATCLPQDVTSAVSPGCDHVSSPGAPTFQALERLADALSFLEAPSSSKALSPLCLGNGPSCAHHSSPGTPPRAAAWRCPSPTPCVAWAASPPQLLAVPRRGRRVTCPFPRLLPRLPAGSDTLRRLMPHGV